MAEIENLHSYFTISFKKEIKELHLKMMNGKTGIKTSDSRRMNVRECERMWDISFFQEVIKKIGTDTVCHMCHFWIGHNFSSIHPSYYFPHSPTCFIQFSLLQASHVTSHVLPKDKQQEFSFFKGSAISRRLQRFSL